MRIFRFALVGVANTLFALGVIFALKWILSLGDALANLIGYAVGLLISFSLNRSWTFRFRGATTAAFGRFCGVVLAAYSVNLALVLAAVQWFEVNGYLAQVLGVAPYSALTYLGLKYWVFVPEAVGASPAGRRPT